MKVHNGEIHYSIVSTVYNDESQIIDFLKCIEFQTIKPDEIIIVDGGSNDETCNIIRTYNKDIKLIVGERCNISQGFNRAIKESVNEWICIIATGNYYEKTYVEKLFQALKEGNEKVDGVYSTRRGIGNTPFGVWYSKEFVYADNGMPTNQGVLINKRVFDDIGYFYENFYYAGEDFEFFRRALRAGKKFQYTDHTCIYRDVPQNYKEYFKQTRFYTIGNMQSLGNLNILKLYCKYIGYTLWGVLTILFLLFNVTRLLGRIMASLYLIFNMQLIIRKGWMHCKARNIKAYTEIICLIINMKYLLNKNKIDEKYLIKGDKLSKVNS